MGFFQAMTKLENAINSAKFGTDPRPLTDKDHDSWDWALDNPKPTIRSKEQAIAAIRRTNVYRWHEYTSSRRWVRKQMKKLGLNPDDERFLM